MKIKLKKKKSLKKGSKLGDDIPLEKNESDKPKKRKGKREEDEMTFVPMTKS